MAALLAWLFEPTNLITAAQVLAALVTAVATIALWRVTRVLAVETAALAKMTAHPFVICYLKSSGASPRAMNLTLENTGNATSFDVRVSVSPPMNGPNGVRNNESQDAFEISLLPPGHELSVHAVMANEIVDETYSVEVSWSTMPGSAIRQAIKYSFKAKDGFRAGWRTKGLHEIAEEIEKISKRLT